MKQFEQVLLHHNPLFDEDEDEGIHEPTIHVFSFEFNEENISKIKEHVENQPQIMSNQ